MSESDPKTDYENYSYVNHIYTPEEIGMGDSGDDLDADIQGIVGYVDLLLFGGGKASKSDSPLGEKYFQKTIGTCYDDNNNPQDRYLYINTIPSGNFLSANSKPGELRGLIPGIIEDVERLNPMNMIDALTQGSKPRCKLVKLPEGVSEDSGVDPPDCSAKSNPCKERYVVEWKSFPEYWFPPSAPKSSYEGFTSMSKNKLTNIKDIPSDPLINLYYTSLGLIGLYFLLKLYMRK